MGVWGQFEVQECFQSRYDTLIEQLEGQNKITTKEMGAYCP